MADSGVDGFSVKLYTLQKRLKGERLFIRQDKDIIRSLNDSVGETCKNVYHLAWMTRQHWRNLDRLVSGRKVFPSECTQTSIVIENVIFEDASKHLGYQDAKYGEFLASLRSNPRLVALVLNCATNHGVDISGITRLLLCCLYGSCILKEDEKHALSVLKHLIEIQVSTADDVLQYFCSPKSSQHAFNLVLRQYSELLFTSKLYLTASLHGAVMQIIVDDLFYLDLEISHVLNRLPPKLIRQKFGDPGTPKANKKMAEYIEISQNCLINLCSKFLKSLRDKIYCFPTSLRWILQELQATLKQKLNYDEKKAKALLGHVLMHYFICPAIVNPEPFGINSDAFISEVARYNLAQVAGLLSSMALSDLGMKDVKVQKLLEKLESGVISALVDAILQDAEKLNPLSEKETVAGLHANAALMTEKELKALVHFMKKAASENYADLKENGIHELLELLPPIPRRWTKQKGISQRSATSLPIAMQLKANPELMKPVPSPRANKNKTKKTTSMYSPQIDIQSLATLGEDQEDQKPQNDKEEYEDILKDLQDMIEKDEAVLVINFTLDYEMPGLLPEEKVLGIKDNVVESTPIDSADVEEERQRRASSMIKAMKDLEGLNFHSSVNEEASSSKDDLDASSCLETNLSAVSTPQSTPNASSVDYTASIGNVEDVFGEMNRTGNSLTDDSLHQSDGWPVSTPTHEAHNESKTNHDMLIAFDDTDVSHNAAVVSQKTPVHAPQQENTSLLDLSPTSCSALFDFPAQSSDKFLDSKSATLGPIGSTPKPPSLEAPRNRQTASLGRNAAPIPTDKRSSYASSGSLLGGLNTILQQPSRTLSSSFALKGDEPIAEEENVGCSLENSMEVGEDAVLAEQSGGSQDGDEGEKAETSQVRKECASNSSSVDSDLDSASNSRSKEDGEKKGYNSPAMKRTGRGIMSCVLDTKSETMKQMKKEMAEQEKRDRKKSSSAWFKGKLATGKEKIKSVKNRSKSDGQAARKGERLVKGERNFTAPESQLKPHSDQEVQQTSAPQTTSKSSNVIEEILNKYRGISPKTAGLMEDDNGSDDVAVNQNIEFDDEFKFEDAKRKLRIVLCMADRSNFPGEASSCFNLLMTFLQAQLAEAINLQDRSVVAQLHETLRSIRQLPHGSCEKLLIALEDDYKQRAPYISYLLRSKQGLLASMSHLEQIRKKVERDKAICSKYFTTFCVRLFLDTPEKKREISQFSHSFEETGMPDEKCALLEEFLEDLYKDMSTDPIWVSALDEQWLDAKIATERTIMTRIYEAAFYPNGIQDKENDKIFHEHIKRLSNTITVNHKALQIPKVLQKEAPWPSAQTELLMINAYKTPAEKLRCIHRCCIAIMNLLSMATPTKTSGADEFVPVLVYVVIRANPPKLLSTKQYINNFFFNRLTGEERYCWAQFCGATEFVKSISS